MLKHFSASDVIGWRDGHAVSAKQFLAVAHALAADLPAGARCMNLCKDRLNFALGLAAALIKGNPTLLPPNHVPAVVNEIAARHGPVVCLADAPLAPRCADIDLSRWPSAQDKGRNPRINGDQLAVIAFTSGSTGVPHAHARTWRSYVEGAAALRARVQIKPGAVVVGTVPPQHMWGLEASILLAMQSGAAIHGASPLLPADVCGVLRQVTAPCWLVTSPVHLRALVLSGEMPPPLAGVLSATAPLDHAIAGTVETATGARVIEIYGTTETGALATRATAHTTRYHFLDGVRAGTTDDLPRVQGGHVHAAVALNDRLRLMDNARFELEGRVSDMVKIGGKRASLAALNLELNAIPGVVDGVFIAPDARKLNARLSAYVVAPSLTQREILAALRLRIDPVFLPRPLMHVNELPRNAAGKLTRAAMQRLSEDAREPSLAD